MMKKNTLTFTDLHNLLLKVESFVNDELIPLETSHRGKTWNEIQMLLEDKREMAKNIGIWTPQIPRKWGGLGLSLWEFGHVSELLGRSPYGHYCLNCQAPDAGNMEILIEFGTPSQQEKFLSPLLEGKIRSCFAMTEPELAGSNPVYMNATARKEGKEYVIDGHKWFTTGADGASFVIVMAVTNPAENNLYKRASQIIVPLDTSGFKLVRNISVMGESGEGWSSHGEILFENCRVPKDYLLGGEGAGFSIAQTRLGPGRIHHCMRWIGICERAFEMMCRYSVGRHLSPGIPLASNQTIKNWIAECRAEINAARLMVLDAARKIDEIGQYEARVEVSIIKFFCANVLQNVLDRAIQVHGGLGMTDDTPLAYWYRHERASRIYDGPDEVHKNRVAGQILKKYGLRIKN